MTRDELDRHIKACKKRQRAMTLFDFWAVTFDDVAKWLEDIRDNGITESKKYRILVMHKGNSHFEIWLFYEGGGVFNEVSDKANIATVKSFTRTQIEDLKKNDDVAIDWDKALEPVEE